MNQKPRCNDVAEAIIQYFRSACAVSTSDGIETNTERLATAIGSTQGSVAPHLKRLIDFKIILLKRGVYEQGYSGPKFLALGNGHEEGNEWKKAYYSEQHQTSNKKMGHPRLLIEVVEASAKATSDKNLLEELVQAYARVKELQEKVLEVQRERNEALETIRLQKARIDELEQDLQITSESARTNQEEVVTLELQLREARSQVAYHDRKITKNDGVVQPFVHR